MNKNIKKFTVDRRQWYRGKGSQFSSLRNDYGQMCCIGFCCKEAADRDRLVNILKGNKSAIDLYQRLSR